MVHVRAIPKMRGGKARQTLPIQPVPEWGKKPSENVGRLSAITKTFRHPANGKRPEKQI